MLLYFKRLLGHKRVRLQRQVKRKKVFAVVKAVDSLIELFCAISFGHFFF